MTYRIPRSKPTYPPEWDEEDPPCADNRPCSCCICTCPFCHITLDEMTDANRADYPHHGGLICPECEHLAGD